jgi:hypothetical protein
VTRPSRAGWVRFPHSPATLAFFPLFAALFAVASGSAAAQARDSSLARAVGNRTLCKKPPDATPIPTVPKIVIAGEYEPPLPKCRVPISPRAALLRSLLVPGLGQFNLDRPKVAGLFVATELGAIGMSFKSKHDLDLATAARRDTSIIFVVDANGQPVIDPATGLQKTVGKPKNQNLADRRRARRTHLEDWLAGIVFNHLFSGADAWVAANLADFDVNVNVSAVGRGAQVAARVAW